MKDIFAFKLQQKEVVICVASLQEQLGLTKNDADFSAVWLTRDQFGMTFLDELGLMDVIDLLALSKGLSKIGDMHFSGGPGERRSKKGVRAR